MRTETPLSTCWVMTDCALSAAMEAISTPRFIGPGCMTSAFGLASATRSGVIYQWSQYSATDGNRPFCWRSRWMRRPITTSAPSQASSMVGAR